MNFMRQFWRALSVVSAFLQLSKALLACCGYLLRSHILFSCNRQSQDPVFYVALFALTPVLLFAWGVVSCIIPIYCAPE
jgi:hypothetical protein